MAVNSGRRKFNRVVLKLSGESFAPSGERGISMDEVVHISSQVKLATQHGCQMALVIGGGNILRGAQFKANNTGIQEATAPLYGNVGHCDQWISPSGRLGIPRMRHTTDDRDPHGRGC